MLPTYLHLHVGNFDAVGDVDRVVVVHGVRDDDDDDDDETK